MGKRVDGAEPHFSGSATEGEPKNPGLGPALGYLQPEIAAVSVVANLALRRDPTRRQSVDLLSHPYPRPYPHRRTGICGNLGEQSRTFFIGKTEEKRRGF